MQIMLGEIYFFYNFWQSAEFDPARRLKFAQTFLAKAAVDEEWLDTILRSDEAIFTECGQVNS